jgi:hypothetical protein
MGWYVLYWSGLKYGPVEGSCEHGNETSGLHKMLGSSWVAAQLTASQEGLSSMNELVSGAQAGIKPGTSLARSQPLPSSNVARWI